MVKITNSNILSTFRKQLGISKADEMAFAEAFQSIFEEALLQDKILKISGLGTFKLIPVESRKSVNVNTGEEIEISEEDLREEIGGQIGDVVRSERRRRLTKQVAD